MQHTAKIICAVCALSNASTLEKWAEYRLAEMLSVPVQSDSISEFFTEEAWNQYQADIASNGIFANSNYHVVVKKFIKPVAITPAPDGSYAQATMMLGVSNASASWDQPIEMLLTIRHSDNGYQIDKYEGVSAQPINVSQYKFDRAAKCELES